MNNTIAPTPRAEKAPDYRPLGYADPVPSAVIRRGGRDRPWDAHTTKIALTLSGAQRRLVTGSQLVVLVESLSKTYPQMKPKKVLRKLSVDELRAILADTVV